MGPKRAFLAIAVSLLIPAVALAGITGLTPTQINYADVESFLTIQGSEINGSISTSVVFTGPAGTITTVPNNAEEDGTFPVDLGILYVPVPFEVIFTPGAYTIDVYATYARGILHSGPVSFTVVAPVITETPFVFVPEIVVAEATSAAGANVTFDVIATSADGLTTYPVTCTPPSGALFALGTHRVTCSASNEFGTSSSSFIVVVTDTTSPVVTVPGDISAEGPVVTFSASATDNLDGSVSVSCTPASGSSFQTGTTAVTCLAFDTHANPGLGSFNVTVTNGLPVLQLPESVSAFTSTATAIVTYTATATSGGTVTCTPASGSEFPLGESTVSCTATNGFGTVSGSFQVFVGEALADTTPPVVMVVDITAEATEPGGAVVTFTPTAIDDVSGSLPVNCTPPSGSLFALGATTVNCSATDAANNTSTATFTVTVVDTTPPAITVVDLTAEATGPAGAVVTFAPTATDIVSGSVAVLCTPASGSTFPLGATTVNCSATDAANNTGTASFTVTVVDTTPPVLAVTDITAEATSAAGAVVTFAPTAVDIVSGSVAVNCTAVSGSTFPLGTTTVDCTAADAANNTGSASFTITVVDTTPPTLTVADVSAEATSAAGAVVTFAPTAADIVSGSVAVICTPASGSTFALGATTVDCTATDAANNTGSASFTVTVVDTTPPEVTEVKATPGSLWPPNHKMVNVVVTVTATDLTDPSPVSEIVSVSSDQPIDGTGDGDTGPDWNVTGPLTLQLRSERSHGKDRTYTITVATTDLFGNFTLSTVQVKVTQQSSSKKRAVSP